MRRLGIYTAVLMATSSLALAAVSGNAGGATGASGKSREQSASAAPGSSKEQMYVGKPDQIRAGDKLFHQHCAACHGENGRGIGKAADLTAPQVQAESPAELAEFLRNGDLWRGMPSWAGIPEERRWQLVAYIKTLRAQP